MKVPRTSVELRFLSLAGALLFASSAALAGDNVAALIDGPAYTQPQQLVEVEPGRRLNLYCVGDGEPVVVFEAGLTDPINVWGLVQPRVGATNRACAYDRAGIGFSDEATRPSSSANIVDDLHRLLAAAGIQRPVVLVAHSAGGMHARLYAYTYPDDVAGLVLIDPSHEEQTNSFRQVDPRGLSPAEWDAQILQPSLSLRRECVRAAEAGIAVGSEEYKKCSFSQYAWLSSAVQAATEAFQLSLKFQRAQLSEEEGIFHSSVDELRAASRPLGRLPVLVLTKDWPPPPTEPLSEDQLRLRAARYLLWKSLGARSAAISSVGVQRVVPGAGHAILLERPEAVVEAVAEIVSKVSARLRPLPLASE